MPQLTGSFAVGGIVWEFQPRVREPGQAHGRPVAQGEVPDHVVLQAVRTHPPPARTLLRSVASVEAARTLWVRARRGGVPEPGVLTDAELGLRPGWAIPPCRGRDKVEWLQPRPQT